MIATQQLRYYPLTHAQKRIWYSEMMYPDQEMSNVGYIIKFTQPKDHFIMEKAINQVLFSNPGLRVHLKDLAGDRSNIQQYIAEYHWVTLERWRVFSMDELLEKTGQIHHEKFDLFDKDLFYIAIL